MIIKFQKPIKFVNQCNCLVDYKELEKAIIWYSDKPVTRIKNIFLYGCYPAISIYDKKIHIHRLLMMYWFKRDLEKNEYVHHLNEQKLDASKLNLILHNASRHQRFTMEGRKFTLNHRKKIGEANRKRKGIKYKKLIYENPELLK